MAKRRKRRSGGEDPPQRELLEFEGGYALLDGRNVVLRTDFDDATRSRLLSEALARIPELESEREQHLEHLDELMSQADIAHVVAASSIYYLLKDANTYRESEDDRSPAHIEYLALQSLQYPKHGPATDAEPSDPLSDQSGYAEAGEGPSSIAVLEGTGPDPATATSRSRRNAATDSEGDTNDHAHVATRAGDQHDERVSALSESLTKKQSADEALHLVREIFKQTADLMQLDWLQATQQPGADEHYEEYRHIALSQATFIRGSAYQEHTEAILRGCLGPFATECRKYLSFTAEEALQLADAVVEMLSTRINDLVHRMSDRAHAETKAITRQRKKKQLHGPLAAMTPTRQKAWIRNLVAAEAFADAVHWLSFTAEDLAEKTGLGAATAQAWLDAFTCTADQYDPRYHRTPTGAHPITTQPFITTTDGHMAPAPTSLLEAMRPRMEDMLRTSAPPKVWQRYLKNRADWTEATATARIAAALPGAKSWVGIDWESAIDSSDLDGLVACDDVTLRIQCKSGRISPAARRGAHSMREDVQAVITDAADQHRRLAEALSAKPAAELGFDADQSTALARNLNLEVIICLDDVTIWSTHVHKLKRLVTLPDTEQTPWILSLADLMAATDLLHGVELVHFLTRRQRLEREGKVEAHDELDWVGHYLHDGLFFDSYFEGPDAPDVYRLLSYTEPIDAWYSARSGVRTVETPKPTQELPVELRSLLRRLENERPKHWVTAGLMLLHGDMQVRTQIGDILRHTTARAAEVGWSAVSQVFGDEILTIRTDRTCSGSPLRRLMRDYNTTLVAEQDRPNVVHVALGADRRIVCEVLESDTRRTIAQALLRRETTQTEPATVQEGDENTRVD